MTLSEPTPQQTLQPAGGDSPPPNEDLTIAESLQLIHLPQESADGTQAFRTADGDLVKIPAGKVESFLHQFGPLHPGDYAEKEGSDWQADFFALAR